MLRVINHREHGDHRVCQNWKNSRVNASFYFSLSDFTAFAVELAIAPKISVCSVISVVYF